MIQKESNQSAKCSWGKLSLESYHDNIWGYPKFKDEELFEGLILELNQSGLSWRTIWERNEGFRKAYCNYNIEKVSNFGENEVNKLVNDSSIIRHKLKIKAVINNANIILQIQKEEGSFSNYIWKFTSFSQFNGNTEQKEQIVATIHKDMKKRGFKFVGLVTIYSFCESIGIFNNHEEVCPTYKKINEIWEEK